MSAPPYSLIYADPPWRMEPWSRATGLARAPDAHYDTMTIDQLCGLPVVQWAADDAMLAMWVVDLLYPEALAVARAWGFTYSTVLFRWLKTASGQFQLFDEPPKLNFGMGRHTRAGGCEECWIFRRGKGLPVLRHDIRREFFAPVREHSRKPDEVPDWIVALYGDHPRLEMFARTRRPGWAAFGNQADKFGAVGAAARVAAEVAAP